MQKGESLHRTTEQDLALNSIYTRFSPISVAYVFSNVWITI